MRKLALMVSAFCISLTLASCGGPDPGPPPDPGSAQDYYNQVVNNSKNMTNAQYFAWVKQVSGDLSHDASVKSSSGWISNVTDHEEKGANGMDEWLLVGVNLDPQQSSPAQVYLTVPVQVEPGTENSHPAIFPDMKATDLNKGQKVRFSGLLTAIDFDGTSDTVPMTWHILYIDPVEFSVDK